MLLLRNQQVLQRLATDLTGRSASQVTTMRPLSMCRSTLSVISTSMVPKRFYIPSLPTSQLQQQSSPSASDKNLSEAPSIPSKGLSSADSIEGSLPHDTMSDSMRARWSPEEKKQLTDLVRQGLRIQEIHSYFPHRTICTLDTRICQLRKTIFKTDSMSKEDIREMRSRKKGSFKLWTAEEDQWLKKRVQQQRGQGELDWPKIANGSPEDGRLGRTATSCKRRWAIIDPEAQLRHGTWNDEESRTLLQAVCKQLNVSDEGSLTLQKEGLHGLKDIDTKQLHGVDWKVVAEAVGTRSNIQCRSHAYKNQRSGAKGRWEEEELLRLDLGLERYGQDWHKLADLVNTRSAYQVKQKYFHRLNRPQKQ
ncbi:hypothetical protein BGZ68_003641 [Mortierella alpina]|nr:hypothetical protein BGZ68_003641 [Mortierella alpina]